MKFDTRQKVLLNGVFILDINISDALPVPVPFLLFAFLWYFLLTSSTSFLCFEPPFFFSYLCQLAFFFSSFYALYLKCKSGLRVGKNFFSFWSSSASSFGRNSLNQKHQLTHLKIRHLCLNCIKNYLMYLIDNSLCFRLLFLYIRLLPQSSCA